MGGQRTRGHISNKFPIYMTEASPRNAFPRLAVKRPPYSYQRLDGRLCQGLVMPDVKSAGGESMPYREREEIAVSFKPFGKVSGY